MEKRPKIELELSKLDLIAEWLSWTMLFAAWVFAIFAYTSLPETIPTHFNLAGEVDAYGSKTSIFVLPIISLVLVVSMSLLNRRPDIFNYPVKITEENMKQQYIAATRLIRWMKLSIMLTFGIILLNVYFSALNQYTKSALLMVALIVLFTFVPVVVYLIVATKTKKNRHK